MLTTDKIKMRNELISGSSNPTLNPSSSWGTVDRRMTKRRDGKKNKGRKDRK